MWKWSAAPADKMATIFVNGCFDLLHEGHIKFLTMAKHLGHGRGGMTKWTLGPTTPNRLIVAVNSTDSARRLKGAKWGENYPKDSLTTRMENLTRYADGVYSFDTEKQLRELIDQCLPCIICKGPDYVGKRVTGDDIAPVLILDTPETEEIRELKRKAYML